MRDEGLNEHLFFSMSHVRAGIAGWVHDFDTARPHSTIGDMTPVAYAATLKPRRTPPPVATAALTRNSQPTIPVVRG